jgi:hypothetical protein
MKDLLQWKGINLEKMGRGGKCLEFQLNFNTI